jgi:hypothetical protein
MTPLTEEEILYALDHSFANYHDQFVSLGQAYSYLIDTRLNVFRNTDGRWAIAVERLGYSPRGGSIELQIYYYGNCLTRLDSWNDQTLSSYVVLPVDGLSFEAAFGDHCLGPLMPDANFLTVRGEQLALSHNPQDYADAGINLLNSESGEISVEEAMRLIVPTARHLFRATEEDLRRSIPADLPKILALDEWFHKDSRVTESPTMSEEKLRQTYELNASFGGPVAEMEFDHFAASVREYQLTVETQNREAWENDRPSSYETWQQIARVIAANDPGLYRPTLSPNTHWSNWPESGSF